MQCEWIQYCDNIERAGEWKIGRTAFARPLCGSFAYSLVLVWPIGTNDIFPTIGQIKGCRLLWNTSGTWSSPFKTIYLTQVSVYLTGLCHALCDSASRGFPILQSWLPTKIVWRTLTYLAIFQMKTWPCPRNCKTLNFFYPDYISLNGPA